MLGKLNMSEFASGGGADENHHYGICRNPWDLDRIIVGSSRGSGSAVAAGMCTAAMGSDTGGSIRIPSALCGIVGLKPTYGRVSRFGVIPLSWSLDHVGPMARSVMDVALMMNAIAGYDSRDPSCPDVPVPDYTRALDGQVKGLRLGIPREYFFDVIHPEVYEAFKKAVALLEQLGASTPEVSIPHAPYSPIFYPNICYPEVAAYHESWYKTRRDDYGPNIKGRIEQGMMVTANAYINAQRLRQVVKEEFRQVFNAVDAIITPTTSVTAPRADTATVKIGDQELPARGLPGRNSAIFNAAGVPALALPCGFGSDGMPISLQITARPFDEETTLRIGYAYEQNTNWHQRHPKFDLAGRH